MAHEQDPKELMMQAKTGDREAFSVLYEQYLTPIYRYIFFRVKSEQEAEDLTQKVFLKVYEAIERYQDRGVSPLAYFYTVARNTVIDYWKKKKDVLIESSVLERIHITSARDHPDRALFQQESAEVVKAALTHLTQDQRDVITLKFIEDLSNQEISEVLQKREDAIRQLQSRGLKKLREVLASPSFKKHL